MLMTGTRTNDSTLVTSGNPQSAWSLIVVWIYAADFEVEVVITK